MQNIVVGGDSTAGMGTQDTGQTNNPHFNNRHFRFPGNNFRTSLSQMQKTKVRSSNLINNPHNNKNQDT